MYLCTSKQPKNMQQNYIKYNAETPPKYPKSSTGKERDSETGFSYFGARYYDSDILTGWLSVDPMADKYPGLSPYAYCAWNPVKLVDPDGEQVQRPPLRYGVFNSNQRFVTSNRQQTVYRNSSSTNVRYSRSGYREISHNVNPIYLKSKTWSGVEYQYNNTKNLPIVELAKFVVNVNNFVSKVTANGNFSIFSEKTNMYTVLGNTSNISYHIVFDNPDDQKTFNEMQSRWLKAYDYIRENYSTYAPNGMRYLTGKGFEKMLELGKSPMQQFIDHFEKNKSNYKIVERESHVVPTIRQANY